MLNRAIGCIKGEKQYRDTRDYYAFSLAELRDNLVELAKRHKAGDTTAIDEFLTCYTVSE
jgi:hypothetical protein